MVVILYAEYRQPALQASPLSSVNATSEQMASQRSVAIACAYQVRDDVSFPMSLYMYRLTSSFSCHVNLFSESGFRFHQGYLG